MADPVNTQQTRLLQESISVQAELTRVLKDNLEYQQRIADRSMAESGGLLRAQQQRNMQTLEWANAVQAAQPPDWGQAPTDRRRRSRKLEDVGQASLSSEWRPELPPNQSQSVPEPDQGEPDRLPPNSPTRDYSGMRGPQDPVQQAQQQTDLKGWQRFRQAMSDQQGGFIRRALGGLTSTATPIMDQGGGDNLPPDSGGRSVGGGGNNLPHPPNAFGFNTGDEGTQTAMTFAMMGEHGGPAWMRNLYLRAWALNRSVGWAGTATDQLRGDLTDPTSTASRVIDRIPGVTQEGLGSALGPVSGALRLAKDHPVATLAGAMTIAGVRDAFGRMADYQPLGQAFGYGPPALGTQSVFGFHNPLGYFGTAAQVGANQVMEQQALQGRIPGFGFGGGLSGQQAQDVTNTLAAQGWRMQPIGGGSIGGAIEIASSAIPGIGHPLAAGEAAFAHAAGHLPLVGGLVNDLFGGQHALQGDMATIAQNYMRPLMQRFPGLKAEDLGQFTPALRYSGTSIQQLTDQLHNLGAGAMATKETIGEFTSSVAQAAQGFRNLGSTQQGGVAVATGFTQATGLDPQIASQAAQSPMVQAMILSRSGVLPSGIGDMSSGAFTSGLLSSLRLAQGALSGLGQTRYQTIHGVRVPIEQGSQVVYDQIAQMYGLDPKVVKQMLQDAPREQARADAGTLLGDFTSNTGLAGMVNAAQAGRRGGRMSQADYTKLTQDWSRAAIPELQQAGIGQKEITRLGHISGLRERIQQANTDLQNKSKNDPWNQLQNKPGQGQTVNVQLGLTPAAQRLVQQVGPSSAKQAANAGWSGGNWNPNNTGPFGYNSVANSPTGDLSNQNPLGAGSSAGGEWSGNWGNG